ncbi:serine hydrolase domain-containing protein [Catenulispora subtropica]|uniref:Serine hydrolase domain-containing protein n=1 Tax=Catenulispora subtropica TaxID=450798 RepID=A0ABN2SET7_9ACTN
MFSSLMETRPFRRAAVTAVAAALLTGTSTPAPAAEPDRPVLRAAMQQMVDAGLTGVQMRVHDRHGDWAGSAGASRLGGSAKPAVDERFRIGSTTKTFTATVVLQLAASRRIALDAPAAGYLPRLGLDRRITVRMLLQHTSGLVNFTGDAYADGVTVSGIPWSGKRWVDNRFHTYRPADLVHFASSRPLKFAPGTDWSYSNTNYVVLRLLIEKVTGHSYAYEIRQRILRPLKLRHTVVPGTSPEVPGPHAHSYYRYQDAGRWRTVDVTRQNPSWISSAGEMISTTADLRTFFAALLGGKLVPAPLLHEMQKPHATIDPTMSYGLGLQMQRLPCGVTVLFHDGDVQGAGTLMYSTPDGKTTMEAAVNYVDGVDAPLGVYRQQMHKLVDAVFCS